MDNLNQAFLEEYKRLDQLCKDFLYSDTGISTYIAIMDDAPIDARRLCNDWDSVYRSLKRLRWKRNKLVHEVGTLEDAFIEQDDLNYVVYFYNQILSTNDPLNVVYKAKKEQERRQSAQMQAWQQAEWQQSQPQQTEQKQSFLSKIAKKIKNFFNS